MAYFDKIKDVYLTRGVVEEPMGRDLASWILGAVVHKAKYEKDYFQIIEFEKLENNILKMIIRQEEVNEKIKENRIEIKLKCKNEKIFKEFDITKLYLIEDEEYDGITAQTLLLPEEY